MLTHVTCLWALRNNNTRCCCCCCSALCNDSTLSYQPGSGSYQRIGESTELALRVFVEKVGADNQQNPIAKPYDNKAGLLAQLHLAHLVECHAVLELKNIMSQWLMRHAALPAWG
jgi:magnesium-transporting ATPase (P-type)